MRRRNQHNATTDLRHLDRQGPDHPNPYRQNLHDQDLHDQDLHHENLHRENPHAEGRRGPGLSGQRLQPRNMAGRPTAILQARVEGAIACSPTCLFCREVAGLPSEEDLSRLSTVAAIAAELQHVMPDPQTALAVAIELEAAAGLADEDSAADPLLPPGKQARVLELE